MGKQKFYVVWDGVTPGIYTSWTECQLQVKGYDSAKYKSFDNREEAERAFAASRIVAMSFCEPRSCHNHLSS